MNFLYLFTSVEGRIGRRTYWLGIILITVIGVPVIALITFFGGGTAGAIANLAFLWCGFASGKAGAGPQLITSSSRLISRWSRS